MSRRRHAETTVDLNVLTWTQRGHQYVLIYDSHHKRDALDAVGRWAADPELNFSWYGAAVLSKRIRDL